MSSRVLASLALTMTSHITASGAPLLSPSTYASCFHHVETNLVRKVLDSGLTLLIREDHSAPVVAIQIWVGTGSIHEDQYLGAGLSHALEHMIFKGTATRGPTDITKAIDRVGGEINAYTSLDRTVYHTLLPSKHGEVGLDVLTDAVLNASLPKEEWSKEKKVILQEMSMGNDDPQRVISKLFYQTAFRVHPHGIPIIGFEDVFRSIEREDLRDFYEMHYVPDNMIVSVVGDLSTAKVLAFLEDRFASFSRKRIKSHVLPKEPAQLTTRVAEKKGPVQLARMTWGFHTVALDHPDAVVLDLLSYIVGRGQSSQLVRMVKEEQKLAYDITAWSFTPQHPGVFSVEASFAPENKEQLKETLEEAIQGWRTSLFSMEEIERAKRMIMMDELSELPSMGGQANSLASGEFYAADPLYARTYLDRLLTVSSKEVQRIAHTYLTKQNSTQVFLLPNSKDTHPTSLPATTPTEPSLHKRVLGNGTRLLVREDHALPFVHICFALRGGLLFEPNDRKGLTSFLSEMLLRGTHDKSADEIMRTAEDLGGSLTAFSGLNSFGLQASCFAHDAEQITALMTDCFSNSIFLKEELEKQRHLQLASIQQRSERPFQIALDQLRQSMFPNHAYQCDPTGTEESIRSITKEDLEQHLERLFSTDNFVASMFGDITLEQATQLANDYLVSIPSDKLETSTSSPLEVNRTQRVTKRSDHEQAILLIGYPSVAMHDSRVDALEVIRESMSGLSSDLGIEVREKRGLVYYIGALQRLGLDPGYFAIYAGTHEQGALEIERLIEDQIQHLISGKFNAETIQRAKEQLIARQQFGLQDNQSLGQTCALNELFGLGFKHALETEQRLNDLETEDIVESAKSIFASDRRVVSSLLPKPKNLEEVKKP